MSVGNLSHFRKALQANPNLCNRIKLYSSITWNKIGFVRKRPGLFLNEITITQNLVFFLWTLAEELDFPIEILESKNERANGNDLEIFVQTPKGYLYLPSQAKIIKQGDRYSSIKYKSQIDMLINHAKKEKGFPTYLLYNHSIDYQRLHTMRMNGCEEIESFGFSLVNAIYLKDNFYETEHGKIVSKGKIPDFFDLHPVHGMPFCNLICQPFTKWYPFTDLLKKDKIHFHGRSEVVNYTKWERLNKDGDYIGFIGTEKKESINEVQRLVSVDEFNPKFRIVISYEKVTPRLFRVS